jgi:hypothetical protein
MLPLVAAVSVGFLYGQSDTAQISGFVRDASNAVVPNASVKLKHETTGLERTTVTNESGYYVVSSLPPGFYTIEVEAPGFKKFVKTQNKLDPSIPRTIDAQLDVGAVTEVVEVVASGAVLQSETATVGKLIDSQQIGNMVLNGRNPVLLALLKPGVRGGSLQSFTFGLSSGGLSINGARTQDFLITFDGAVAIRTRANGTSIGTADVDSVQEIQILTANYAAEYGRSAGGQVRIVTKSGTREFHGTAYEYFRNRELDANSWSRNRAGQPRQTNKFNQFGYNISGPLYIPDRFNRDRNKLFFLWSQEWVRYRPESTSITIVPSLAMRRGDFSELLSANPFFTGSRVVRDPDTSQPFPNNVIPQSRLSRNGIAFLNAYPEPTPGFLQGRNNFFQTRPAPQNQRKDTISLDFVPNERHTFRFRHQIYEFFSIGAFREGFDRSNEIVDRPNKTASVNYVWTVSPTMVNELLLTASVDRVHIDLDTSHDRFKRSKYGINYPYLLPEGKEVFDRIPTLAISNFQALDGNRVPLASTGPVYVISNNVSKVVGNHTFKLGVLFERLGQNDFDQINVQGVPGSTNNQNGRFEFTDTRTGSTTTGLAIANAAMGLFTNYAELGPRAFTPYRSHTFEWFVQDSWKVTPKLRLEFGLRHTLMNPYYKSLWGNMTVFDPSRYDPARAVVQDRATGFIISGDQYNGVRIPGKAWPDAARGRVAVAADRSFDRLFNGGSVYWGEFQKLNFAPRLGIAYQITPQTVIRAGYGRFFSRPGVSDNIFLGGNPPIQPLVTIANGLADSPGGGRPSNFPFFFMTTDPVFKIPAADMWNVTVERNIGLDTTVSLGYVGRVGLHLERERNLNGLPVGTLQNPANAGASPNVLRPYKGFGIIALGENAARSEYNGLQLEVNRRFTKGLSYGFAYTLAKTNDNASGRRDRIWNPSDDRIFWGPSGFDTRHIAVINFIYQLPFLRGATNALGKTLGNWQLTGAIQFQTGTPFTVGTNDDFAGIGSVGEFQPWQVNGNPVMDRGERRFANSAAEPNFAFRVTNADGSRIFAEPQRGGFSNQTRNLFHNTGFQNWNLALFKDFLLTEKQRIQLRGEFFNFPNHPNWGGIDTGPRSGTFGKITSKSSERNVQLVLRYQF